MLCVACWRAGCVQALPRYQCPCVWLLPHRLRVRPPLQARQPRTRRVCVHLTFIIFRSRPPTVRQPCTDPCPGCCCCEEHRPVVTPACCRPADQNMVPSIYPCHLVRAHPHAQALSDTWKSLVIWPQILYAHCLLPPPTIFGPHTGLRKVRAATPSTAGKVGRQAAARHRVRRGLPGLPTGRRTIWAGWPTDASAPGVAGGRQRRVSY